MKKVLISATLIASSALMTAHAESAFVEQAAIGTASLTPIGSFGLGIEYPLPSSLGLPVDTALEAELGATNLFENDRGFEASIGVKALVFPSLVSEPSIALAVRADATYNTAGYGSIQFGPLVTLDFTPLTVSAGLYPAFNSGGFGLNYSLGARYYFDDSSNNAIEISADGTNGSNRTNLKLGLRLAF